MQIELTPEQVLKLAIIYTVAFVVMFILIICIVLYFNYRQRAWNKELEELRKQKQASREVINTEDEYLTYTISGGRTVKIKNRNWKGNTLSDNHIMD